MRKHPRLWSPGGGVASACRRMLAAGALLAATLLPASGALAADPQASSPDQAVSVSAQQLSGHLDASAGAGKFAFYKFIYPADGSTATVNVQISPDDSAILQYAGIKVYGPDVGREYVSGGQQPGVQPNVSGNISSSDPNQKGIYTVQVFNYNMQTGIDFQIWVTGLPVQVTPTAVPALVAPPAPGVGAPAVPAAPAAPTGPAAPLASPAVPIDNSTADHAAPFVGTASGAVPGGMGGHFLYYRFDYPGNTTVTLSLQATPNDQAVLQYVGFKVYGPTVGREYLSAGAQKDATPSATADLFTQEPGQYVVQVYNYVPNADTTVNFTLSSPNLPPQAAAPTPQPAAPVPAAPAPAAPAPAAPVPAIQPSPTAVAAGDNSTPDRAIQIAGRLSGSLAANSGGNFAYYKFTYPGDGSIATINLQVSPDDATLLTVAGFKLYGPQPGKEYLTGTSQQGQTPNVIGNLSSSDGGLYTVQVYNYSPQTPINYTIWVSGSAR